VTEWHLGWQAAVPPERREVVIGSHRADIVTASGGVVEIQHSPITAAVIAAREEFYGSRMAWIFDATRADITMADVRASRYGVCGCDPGTCSGGWGPGRCRVMLEKSAEPGVRMFRWRHPRRSVSACRRDVLLDLGDGRVLRVTRFAPGTALHGALISRLSVEG
jgi:hypothetical protein